MSTPPPARVLALMESAWTTRREALESTPEQGRQAFARARDELDTALGLLSREESPVAFAHVLHMLANIESDTGEVARAQQLWEEAVQLLRGTDAALQLAHKLRHLGDLHRMSGRPALARGYLEEALLLYREHARPDSLDFANALARVAALEEEEGDVGAALVLWLETRDLYAGLEVAPGVDEAEVHIRHLRRSGPRGLRKARTERAPPVALVPGSWTRQNRHVLGAGIRGEVRDGGETDR